LKRRQIEEEKVPRRQTFEEEKHAFDPSQIVMQRDSKEHLKLEEYLHQKSLISEYPQARTERLKQKEESPGFSLGKDHQTENINLD